MPVELDLTRALCWSVFHTATQTTTKHKMQGWYFFKALVLPHISQFSPDPNGTGVKGSILTRGFSGGSSGCKYPYVNICKYHYQFNQ